MAILAVFCISVAEMLVGKPIFENHREYIAGILAAAGVAAWFVGRFLERRRRSHDEPDTEPVKQFVLFDLRYWGPMLLALGVTTLFIRPLKLPKHEQVAVAPQPAPKKEVVEAPPPEPQPPKEPVIFPELKMQGVFFRETRSFAIINGHSYSVGDHVGDVIIKAIDRTSVVLELSGEMKLLTLN